MSQEESSDKKFLDRVDVGDYIEIDLEKVESFDKNHSFSFYCGVLKGVERVRIDGSFFSDTREFLDGIMENRGRYQAAIEQRQASNYANFRQTSYDMPPK